MTDKHDTEHLSSHEVAEVAHTSEAYRKSWDEATEGPQLEGLTQTEVVEALADPQTITYPEEKAGVKRDMPLLTPIKHSGWYNPSFYEAVDSDTRLYFAATPEAQPTDLAKQLQDRFAGQTITVFYDHLEGDGRDSELLGMLQMAGLEPEPVTLGLKGEEASLTQFAGPAMVKDREKMLPARQQRFRDAVEVGSRPEHTARGRAARTLEKPVTDDEFEQIWSFYGPSFEELNSGHPLVQSFDREGLKEMLDSDDALVSVAEADGKIVSLAFLSPVQECPWLNLDYYRRAYPDQFFTGNIVHMPTVVTDAEYRGMDMTTQIFREFVDCLAESGNDVILLGECNDFTVDIIPLLADAFFADKESRMSLDWSVAGVYKYGAYRFTVPARS